MAAAAAAAVELIEPASASCLRTFDAGQGLGNLLLGQAFLLQEGDALGERGLLDLGVLEERDPIQDEVLAEGRRGGRGRGRGRKLVVVHPFLPSQVAGFLLRAVLCSV